MIPLPEAVERPRRIGRVVAGRPTSGGARVGLPRRYGPFVTNDVDGTRRAVIDFQEGRLA